ncbi:MAG: IS110 family transposase [Elusimicrobia bacterium]|nr:IS110 family transposase [Candidatus Liberimonas magnetica]
MQSISKVEQFRQVRPEIQKNKDYLLIGIDAAKNSSVACFYNIEKEILLRKYYVNHNLEDFQKFTYKIEQTMEMNNLKSVIIGVEPTANYHKPLSEYLKSKGYLVVYVSSVAAKSNRKTIDGGRWGKNDPRDAYNVADLMRQGKIMFYRDENTQASNIRKYLLLRQRLMKTKTSLKTRIQNNIWTCHFPELGNIFPNAEDPDVLTLLEHCPSSDNIKKMDFQYFMSIFSLSVSQKSKRYLRLTQTWQAAKTSIGFPMPSAIILESKLIARDIQRTKKDIAEIDKILFAFCMQDDVYRQLLSIPGYGIFTTSVFKSNINIDNFISDRQITKFAGLDIETMSSGKFQGKEKISKKGNSLLRYAVCQAANIAIAKNKIIRQMFQDKLKERGNSKTAKAKLKIKFVEKFLRTAFVMLKNNAPFDINQFNVPVDDPVLDNVRV